jgi:predicted nucleic acid-binding protein
VGSQGAGTRVTTSAITFDAGALIAIERRSRRMQALLEEIDRRNWQVAVPAGAVAQAWRGGSRQARIAALLSDERTEVVGLDDPVARAVGLLCGRSGHVDVVDVSVAVCARQRNLHVVTSDPGALRAVDDALILHVP